ncbi:hypothetical protein [Burkholderia cenocepacia]|nr:hypothetical protein [Burkholderia cenocepacia]MCA8235328.1 hypothetical protein [Burkholderia cenocepacia]
MNEQYACAVARLAARYAACFPIRQVTGRAARPVRPTMLRFKESRHV